MTTDTDQGAGHLNYLRNRCAEESKRFFHRQAHDTRFCFELFRRAILNHDEEAWEYLYQQYQPLVAGWVEKHTLFQTLNEEKDFFVNRAFEKMWASISPVKFAHFSDLNGLLRYLKMCVGSVIIDYGRSTARFQIEELAESGEHERYADSLALEEQVFERVQSQELWGQIKALSSNAKEYRVLYDVFVLDLKPREILENYPGEFKSIQEIYRIKENLLERLRRDHKLMEYLTLYAGEKG